MSAAEMARASGQQPDPMLTLGIDNLPVTGGSRFSTNAEDMTMKRIGIAQEWVSADKRSAREAVSGAMHRRESVMEGVAAADARMQTAMAYVEAYYAGEALKLTALNEKHAREELETGKGRLATLSGNSAEVLGLASALGAAEDESAETRQQQAAAVAGLSRWTGDPSEELAAPNVAIAPTSDAYVAAHPLVVAKQRDIEVARQEVEVARLSVADVQAIVATAIGGENVGEVVSGRERFPINVRYPREIRDSLERLRTLPFLTDKGAQLLLQDVAHVRLEEGPPMLRSENARLSGWVYVDVRGRDLRSVVRDMQAAVVKEVVLPAGYAISWSGQFEYLERAAERMKVVVPATLAVIFALLYLLFRNAADAVLVMAAVPFSLVGGFPCCRRRRPTGWSAQPL